MKVFLYDHGFFLLFALCDIADWPAIVNRHEAKAYCLWKSYQEGQPDNNKVCIMILQQNFDPQGLLPLSLTC
jgi:hypothetical protein